MKKQMMVGNYFRTGLAIASLVGGLGVLNVSPALAAGTYTWSGAAGDGKFSTAANWAEASAPTDGATLVFPCVVGAPAEQVVLTNDLVGVRVSSFNTPSGVEGCRGSYQIDTIDFNATASVSGSMDNSAFVRIDTVTGVSDLTYDGAWTRLNVKEGNVTLPLNSLTVTDDPCGLGVIGNVHAANLTIGAGSSLWPQASSTVSVLAHGKLGVGYSNTDATVDNNITFAQGSEVGAGHACMGQVVATSRTVTLTGDIVLNGDVTYDIDSNVTLKITGNLSGSGKFVKGPNSRGILNIAAANNTSGSPNGVVDSATPQTVTYDGDKSTQPEYVTRNTTATLDGVRGVVTVNQDAVLNGNGTADYLLVAGTIAPGHSPGKITVVNSFDLAATGVYSAEILSTSSYDQIVAGGVLLDPASKLQLTLVPGATIKKGDTFTIISNTGANPVSGTFAGLAEGAQVVVSGETFTISYVGGDGNDVVLTALNNLAVPGTPNTGVAQLLSNPVGVTASSVAMLSALVYLFKRK